MKKQASPLFLMFAVILVSCLLISNTIANRLVQIGPWSITAAVIIFPISYILNDVLTEVYGFKKMRTVIWLGFAMNALMSALYTLTNLLPAPVWFEGAEAYRAALGNVPRTISASLLAYLIGSWINAAVLSKMKVKSKGKNFGLRAVASTLIGELCDSLIFVPIAFLGLMPTEELIKMGILQVLIKTLYEIVVLPVTTIVVKKVKKYEQLDTFDEGVSYKLI